MSLILDALRKMELERKAKRQGLAEIRAEVLRYHGNPQPARRPLLPAAALLLFIAAAAAALYFFRTGGVPSPPEPVRTEPPQTTARPVQPAAQLPPAVPVASEGSVQPKTVPPPPKAAGSALPKEETPRTAGGGDITISGIAWQEERSLRRAVINGTLLSEGDEVSGAEIIEIRENLVRFHRGGRTFEVIHSSGSGR